MSEGPDETMRGRCTGPTSRREFLKVGLISGLGLTLGDFLFLRQAQASAGVAAKADSVIFIFFSGGMSHIETFDPKPYAPIQYRGDLGHIKTNTGEHFGGLFKNLAGHADKMTVLRSLSHGEAAHERGQHNMLTGYRPSGSIQYPSLGAVVAHEYGPRRDLPPYITIPDAGHDYLGTGYLGAAYGPFSVGGEPAKKNFKVRDLSLPDGISPERLERRRSLLETVDAHFAALEESDLLDAMDEYYQRAYSLISSQSAREAFAIDQEEAATRDKYGRDPFGQRLLLSRRLVEGGARFVTVVDNGWDHHERIKPALQNKLPPVDQGVSALLQDLQDRGLLERTLVVMSTEFGRTAKLNPDGGRDHWPKAFSVMMAGGGVGGGQIYGETDPQGAEPTMNPVSPEDVAATIYSLLGIDPAKKLMSPGDRPIDIVRHGSVLHDILV